jgi:hypothetical protein
MWSSDGNSILGNHMYDIGGVYNFAAAGVIGQGMKNNTIAYNHIENSTRYGISIKDGGWNANTGNIIEFNRILNTNTETNDTGAIEMLGRSGIDTNTVIRYNYIEDTGVSGAVASGVYLDDLTSGVEIYGNFIKNAAGFGFLLHGGRNIAITNNVVILADEPIDDPYSNNQLNQHRLFVWEQAASPTPRLMENVEWSTNIISAPDGLTPDAEYWMRWGELLGEPKVTNNLLHNVNGYDEAATGTPEAGSIFADPLFVDPANGDYSLQANSTAFSLGFEPLPFSEMGLDGFEVLDLAVLNESLAMYLGYNPIFGIEDGDSLAGTDVDDLLHGAGGNDVISGGIGADVLFGGAGNDTLDGGAGNDMIYGGTGADTINVSQGSDLVIYQNLLDGNDIINGFNAAGTDNDVISLDALFDGLFVDTAERANRILVEANGDMQTLRVDTSGDGSFDLTVATVSFIDGNLLNVGMETEDVQYGSL